MVAREDCPVSVMNIAAHNSGSSSLKFGLYRVDSAGSEKLFGETFYTVSTVSQSMDTSLGLTPSGGVIMGTRSGNLDPGVLVYLMGGVDRLVFTGGIGETDAQVRHEICSGLAWLGISLDESRKRAASNPVSDGASRCQVFVLASPEDGQIARHVWALLA